MLVDGTNLYEVLKKEGEQPEIRVRDWTLELIEGLQYLHGSGYIHRDLKPANLMLTKKGVVIADYGLAREYDPFHRERLVLGTMHFAAPEQHKGQIREEIDAYGLGATMFNLLTKRVPSKKNVKRLLQFRPDISMRTVRTIFSSMSQNPETRPDLREIAEELYFAGSFRRPNPLDVWLL